MSDNRLIRSEVFPGMIDDLRSLMQRLARRYAKGWVSTDGKRLRFREYRQIKRELVHVETPTPTKLPGGHAVSWKPREHYKTADVTTPNRGSWEVSLVGDTDREGYAGIEAYERFEQTQVDFWDGYHPQLPSDDYPQIGAAFEEFCEMVVREMQLLMSTREEAGKKPGPIDTKLDALLVGQTAIREDLSGLHQVVLARFDASEQTIIAAVIERLDQGQLATVQAVLDTIEAELVPIGELEETLVAVQHMLSEIQQKEVALPYSALTSEEVEHLSEVVDAPKLDAKHKLKVTVPIIPFLLSYEGEVELKSGLNLEAAWRRLVGRVQDTSWPA